MNLSDLRPHDAANITKARAMLAHPHLTPEQAVALERLRTDLDDEPATVHATRGYSVRLDAGVPTDGSALWQQVAVTGDYRGYQDGEQPFQFTAQTFQQIIANFHASPQYRPDGSGRVVSWDVAHQSVQPGNHPESYAAVGWIGELQMRPSASGVGLWALTTWTPDMSSAIKQGEFCYASVVVDFQTIDPLTAADLGPTLCSVAVTNTPFIPSLERLVASRGGHPAQPSGVTPMHAKQFTLTLPKGVAPGSAVALQLGQAALTALKLGAEATGDTNQVNKEFPTWRAPVGAPLDRLNEILNQARAAGLNGARPEPCLAWLRGLGQATIDELGLDDPTGVRQACVVGYLLGRLGQESRPVSDQPPGRDMVPSPLSRAPIDARDCPGRNTTERAVVALRASSSRFAALDFGSQVSEAAAAVRTGRVVA